MFDIILKHEYRHRKNDFQWPVPVSKIDDKIYCRQKHVVFEQSVSQKGEHVKQVRFNSNQITPIAEYHS
jgi:hypothetical protein